MIAFVEYAWETCRRLLRKPLDKHPAMHSTAYSLLGDLTLRLLMDKHSLLTVESIEAWIAKNGAWGKNKLTERMVAGEFKGESAKAVLDYLMRDAGFPLGEVVAQTTPEREARTSEALPVRNAWATRWVSWVGIVALALGVWQLVGV